jgi:hypothetical protein
MEMPPCPVLFDWTTSVLAFCNGSLLEILLISSCISRGEEVEVLDDSTLIKFFLFEQIWLILVDVDASVSVEETATSSCARMSEAPDCIGECSTEKITKHKS